MVAITKPTVGGDNGTWGSKLNTALDALANAVTTLETGSAGGSSGGIPTSTVTARGDLLVGTANNTVGRQGLGTAGYALYANSASASGLIWKLPTGTLVAQLRQTTTQGIARLTYVAVTFQTADFDRANNFTTGTRYTIPATGYYELSGGVSFDPDTDTTPGARIAQLVTGSTTTPTVLAGSTNTKNAVTSAGVPTIVATRTIAVLLTAGDTVGVRGYHNSTTTPINTTVSAGNESTLTIRWLGNTPGTD